MRTLATVLAGLLLTVVGAPLAGAATTVEEVAASLRADPVFVDPDAERAIDDGDADDLRADIRDGREAIFVAVLPASMGSATSLVSELREATGLAGTYAVIAGDSFRAGSDTIADADSRATAAFQSAREDGATAVLREFVRSVNDGRAVPSPGDAGSSSDTRDAPSAMPILLLGGAGLAALLWFRNRGARRRMAESRAADEADRQLLRAELSVLADDVMRLEPQVQINEAARADYEAAVSRFRAAEAALDYADEAVDLVRVERVVLEAQYAMSRARAIVEGREPPPPPEELRRPGRHDEPPLDVDERGEPAYVGYGGGFYGGGGWFGGGGGLFTGLMLGQMLGGFGGFGGHQDITINNYDGDGGGGWGDFGGGDFGGGDVGGGDW